VRLAFTALLVMALPLTASAEHTPTQLILGMEAAYASVDGYTTLFARQERIGDRLRPREEALLKFQRPGRLYLRWISGAPKGREILYLPGENDGKLLVHEPGVVSGRFTLLLAPDSARVLAESRHPVTDIGIGKVVERVVAEVTRGLRKRELRLSDAGESAGSGRRVRRVEIVPLAFATGEYYAHRTIVEIDLRSGLPVALTALDAADRLVAWYGYDQVQLDAELRPLDFDPDNPEYRFPRWRLPL
jgi:uncharacterized protein DUF1571